MALPSNCLYMLTWILDMYVLDTCKTSHYLIMKKEGAAKVSMKLKAVLHGSTCNNDFPRNTVSWKVDPRVTCHRERFSAQHWVRQHVESFLISFKNTIRCCHENWQYVLRGKSMLRVDPCNTTIRIRVKKASLIKKNSLKTKLYMPVALTNMSRETSYCTSMIFYNTKIKVRYTRPHQLYSCCTLFFLPSIIRDLSFFIGRGGAVVSGGASEHF